METVAGARVSTEGGTSKLKELPERKPTATTTKPDVRWAETLPRDRPRTGAPRCRGVPSTGGRTGEDVSGVSSTKNKFRPGKCSVGGALDP